MSWHVSHPKIHDWKQAKATRSRVVTSAHDCITFAGSPTLGLLASRLRRTPITCQGQTQHNKCSCNAVAAWQLVSSSAMYNIHSSANTNVLWCYVYLIWGKSCTPERNATGSETNRAKLWKGDQNLASPRFALCNFLRCSWHNERQKKNQCFFACLLILLIMSSDTELILAWSRPNLWVAPAEKVLTKKAPSEPCL